MESTRRIEVGYGLAPKKQSTIITPSLISYAAERGVDLVLIDATMRLCDQGPFDCVIHKLYDEGWRSQLRDFADRNPGVPIIDSLQAIERTHNRISMLEVVSELRIPPGKETLGVPEQVVVQDSEVLSDPNSLASVRFPVIVKPLLATGAISHSLSLSFNREALVHLKLESPVVLQEFVNHGGVIFKAYVVGDQVECVKRKSLPDLTEEDLQNHQGIVPFSSVSNKPSSMEMEERFLNECRMPSPDFIAGVAKELRRVLELHLFNFDLIRDMRAADRYLLIDINYFPGYWKMPEYERMFTDFFLDIVHKSQRCRLDLCGGINPDRHKCEADTKTK